MSLSTTPYLQEHLDECIYALLSCPNTGCDEVVRKSNLDKHLLECEFSPVMCELCSKDIILKDKEVSFTPDVLLINTLLCRECVSSS